MNMLRRKLMIMLIAAGMVGAMAQPAQAMMMGALVQLIQADPMRGFATGVHLATAYFSTQYARHWFFGTNSRNGTLRERRIERETQENGLMVFASIGVATEWLIKKRAKKSAKPIDDSKKQSTILVNNSLNRGHEVL